MDIEVIDLLMGQAAIAAEPNVAVKDVLGSLPTIYCVILALKGGRPMGSLNAVTIIFPQSFVSDKDAKVAVSVYYGIFDSNDDGFPVSSHFTFKLPYLWYCQLMA